jgi:hypothetical protein
MQQPSSPLARLSPAWEPGAWIGVTRHVFGPLTEVGTDEVVEVHPPHLLLALWRPQRLDQPFLGRWPHMVWLSKGDSVQTSLELLRQVPSPDRLWLTPEDIDWALLAEIVLRSEEGLRPFHHRELERFIAAEREATSQRISRSYSDEQQDPRSHSGTALGRP